MKLFKCLLFALCLCLLFSAPAFAVNDPVFTVQINGALDPGESFNGQNTLVLDWQIMTDREGLTLRYAQGLRLAYDNTVLQLMKWDGSEAITDSEIVTTFSPISKTGLVGDFDTSLMFFAASDDSGKIGYLNFILGSPFDAFDCPRQENISLARVRFGFRTGKSADDLRADSIRPLTASELDAFAQSTAILLNTDENDLTSYEYLKQSGGSAMGGDTLNAPAITYPQGSAANQGSSDPSSGSTETDISSGSGNDDISTSQTGNEGDELTPFETPVSDETDNLPAASGNSDGTDSDGTNPDAPKSGMLWLFITLAGVVLLAGIVAMILKRPRRK